MTCGSQFRITIPMRTFFISSLRASKPSPNFTRMQKGGWVYILTNKHHSDLYTGVTSNLVARMQEHRSKIYLASFTSRYNVDKLIYFFLYDAIEDAIAEEKRIKGGSRKAKIDLVQTLNPQWKDLWIDDVCKW